MTERLNKRNDFHLHLFAVLRYFGKFGLAVPARFITEIRLALYRKGRLGVQPHIGVPHKRALPYHFFKSVNRH